MSDHRIRMTDKDIALVLAALRARRAMSTGLREHRIDRLIERLGEGVRGNPRWIHDVMTQTHEEDIDPDDLT